MARKLRPSSAYRWIACPGSVRMEDGLPDQTSVFAAEGTAAHFVAEQCLKYGYQAKRFIGQIVYVHDSRAEFEPFHEKAQGFEVTYEMVDAVQVYLDEVRSHVNPAEGDELHVEQWLTLPEIPNYGGTADAIVHKHKAKKLVVLDLKYGRGVAVSPEGNPQALSYAAMAARRFHNHPINEVEVVIVQPRAEGPGVKRWVIDFLDLFDWTGELIEAAARTEQPDAPLDPGSHCKFCKAAAICPALQWKVAEEAVADFADDGSVILSDPTSFTPQRLARVLENAGLIEDWVNRVREYAHSLAESGVTIPGWKLVQKRAIRKWEDEEAAEAFLLGELDLTRDQIFEEKIKSPAKIEAVLGRKRKDEIAHLVVAVSSGTVLAPEADRREAVKSDPAADFY